MFFTSSAKNDIEVLKASVKALRDENEEIKDELMKLKQSSPTMSYFSNDEDLLLSLIGRGGSKVTRKIEISRVVSMILEHVGLEIKEIDAQPKKVMLNPVKKCNKTTQKKGFGK